MVGGLKGGGRTKGGKVRRVHGGYMMNFEAREYILPYFFVVFRAKKIFPAPPDLAWPSTPARLYARRERRVSGGPGAGHVMKKCTDLHSSRWLE